MPRAGLTRGQVVDAAERIADEEGLDAVTLARVARDLGVRPPSLYNHVEGRDALQRELALRGLEGMAAAWRDATVGLAGDDALRALATAYRTYALEHPGLSAATTRAPDRADAEMTAAAEAVVTVLLAVLAGYGLEGEEAIHAARSVRSALFGFVSIEAAGGFALAEDTDESFTWMVSSLGTALITAQNARRTQP